MKYISKVVWLVIAVIFIASVIIGLGVIFAVKNVNVSLESYSYKSWEEMTEEEQTEAGNLINGFKAEVLGKYKGKLIGSVSEEKIEKCFEGTDYVLESFNKHYPCTLNITLKERRETFAISTPQGYKVYDENGEFFRMKSVLTNNVDGALNIIADVTEERIKDVASVSGYFADSFSALRSMVEKISVDRTDTDNMTFSLRCGLGVRIVDYKNLAEAKIRAAYSAFENLSGEQKTCGTVIAGSSGGYAAAEYFPAK